MASARRNGISLFASAIICQIVLCDMPAKTCFKAPITRAALSAGIVGNSNPPDNASDVSVYKSEYYCQFRLNASYYLTWAQARDFCALYNATLPMMRTAYGWQQLRIYTGNRRFWTGFLRNGSSAWTWQPGSDLAGSLATEDFVKTGNTTGVEWSKSEPSNSFCIENCTMLSYDGGLADYPCDIVPPWDSCAESADVVLTVCHRSDIEVCRYISQPPTVPTPHDYYIIILATFATIIGCTAIVLGVRLTVKMLERRYQPARGSNGSKSGAKGRKLRKRHRGADQEDGQEMG